MADALIRIQNVDIFLEGDIPKSVKEEIKTAGSYVVPDFKFTNLYKQQEKKIRLGLFEGEPWDGVVSTVKPYYNGSSGLKIPAGLLSYVREILRANGINAHIQDERPAIIQTPGYSLNGLYLRDYQRETVDTFLNRGRGVLRMSTGAGKTECVIAMIVEAGAYPAIFYVNSCDLLEQAYDRMRKYITYNGSPAEIGRIGGGHCDIKPITIATVQSCERTLAGKYTKNKKDDFQPDDKTKFNNQQQQAIKNFVAEAQFSYVDECHHVSAETFQTILNSSHQAKLRVGGSASPWRDDGLDILIEACFGRYLCDISASFLINGGYLVKPYITFNHFCQHDLGPAADFQTHYNVYVSANDARNLWIADRTKFHVERDRPTIVLVKWTSHAEILQEMMDKVGVSAQILTSSGKKKKSPKKRKEILDQFRNREIMCIIGTSLLDEGVDVPAASAGIFAGGGKSSTRELQRVGRLIRKDPNDPEKKAAFIEEFHDHTKWLSGHAKTRRKILQLEKEFDIGDKRII